MPRPPLWDLAEAEGVSAGVIPSMRLITRSADTVARLAEIIVAAVAVWLRWCGDALGSISPGTTARAGSGSKSARNGPEGTAFA
jgi:hypothetical protein